MIHYHSFDHGCHKAPFHRDASGSERRVIKLFNVTRWVSAKETLPVHYSDVIMNAMASQITRLTIIFSFDYSGADQTKHQSYASLAFVRGIHRGPVNSPHKRPVTRQMFPFDDVIFTLTVTGYIHSLFDAHPSIYHHLILFILTH